jgi:3-phosphoshikimate 1-carboxyvinyltransferase
VSNADKNGATKTITPVRNIGGTVTVPSSKSHTIRALLIAALAEGPSTISNILDSADARSCIAGIKAFGAECEILSAGGTEGLTVAVTPVDQNLLREQREVFIDVGNSGTTLYMMTALAALQRGSVHFDGDSSIRTRSAGPLLDALRQMGATVSGGPYCPYSVGGPVAAADDAGIAVASPTSQYLSALLLTAPLIGAGTTTLVPTILNEHPYVDMTCWWLERQGIVFQRHGYERFMLPSGQRYRPVTGTLPGDYSSATFWFCAGALSSSGVTVRGLDPEDVQGDRQVLNIMRELGCTVTPGHDHGVATVTVTGPMTRGGVFDLNAMPDALPALAAVACYGPEEITLGNVPQAREKETDRIAMMARELGALGASIRELPDGLVITPTGRGLMGGRVDSHGDHRIAMALAVSALAADRPVTIQDAAAAAVTYPAFYHDLAQLGGDISLEALE